MNERDELATVIHRRICEDSLSECLEDEGYCVKAANEILAAGYSKPRTIVTTEELDALPDESVVRSDFGVTHEKRFDFAANDTFWSGIGSDDEYTSGKITLPATVLYTPKES